MAQNLADSPFLEIESQYITDNPEMRKAIQKGGKQICESCMSVNCRLKQLISIQLELNELQTNLGCEGSPKLTFADIRTKEAGATGPATPTAPPQPSAASRTVSAFLGELDEEESNAAGAVARLRINVVSLRMDGMEDYQEDPEQPARFIEQPVILTEPSTDLEEVDEMEENQSSVSKEISAFLDELEGEGYGAALTTTTASFTAVCKIKRPEITKYTIPTKYDIERGGYRSCVICLKPDISMYAMKLHVISAHNIKIGDPLSRWLQAAQAWDKYLEDHPDYESDDEIISTSIGESSKKGAPPKPNKPAPPAKNDNYLSPGSKKRPKKKTKIKPMMIQHTEPKVTIIPTKRVKKSNQRKRSHQRPIVAQ